MLPTLLILARFASLMNLCPHPLDLSGVGLRVIAAGHNPYLVGESIGQHQLELLLFNSSHRDVKHDSLMDQCKSGALKVRLLDSKDTLVASLCILHTERDAAIKPSNLAAGHTSRSFFRLSQFGYDVLVKPGRYRLEAEVSLVSNVLISPSQHIHVVAVAERDVLYRKLVHLEGFALAAPDHSKELAEIQQVQIASKTWLIYTRYLGTRRDSPVDFTARLVQLSGKCEMSIDGAFGAGNPITITYREQPYHKFDTKIVINSTDGKLWTAEEEKLRQEKLKREGKLPPTEKK